MPTNVLEQESQDQQGQADLPVQTEGAGEAEQEDLLHDPDDLELAEARRAAAEGEQQEGEGGAGEEDAAAAGLTGPEEGQGPEQEADQGEQLARQGSGSPMIPKARFDEVLRQAQEARERAIYLEGALQARQQQGRQQGQQQAQKSIPQMIQEARAHKAAAAKRFDDGQISMSEYERVRDQVDDHVATLRSRAYALTQRQIEEQRRRSQPRQPQQPATPQVSLADQHLLEQQATDLYAGHPYLEAMSDADMQVLKQMAYAEAQRQGRPYGSTLADTYHLRQHVARLSDLMGPTWYPAHKPQQQASTSAKQPGGQQQTGSGLSAQAQARLQKMEQAAGHPPNTNDMGAAGRSEHISDEQIMGMSDEDIAALPARVRHRLIGG